jgi:uncharacterized membrane protein YesL
MNILDSRFYQALKVLADFFILNLMWLLACLPILTIFPATAAMFGVCREWVKGRNADTIEAYFSLFKRNFKQSLYLELVWSLIGGVLLANYALLAINYDLIRDMSFGAKFPLFVWSVLTGLTYLFTSVYLFPVMVNYDTSSLGVLKTSLLLSVSGPLTTLLCLLTLAISVVLLWFVPISLGILGSFTAYLIYSCCDRNFRTVPTLRR